MTTKKNKPSLVALAKQLDTKKRPVPAPTREVKASDRAFIESTLRAKPAPITSSRSTDEKRAPTTSRAKAAPSTTSRETVESSLRSKTAPATTSRATVESSLRGKTTPGTTRQVRVENSLREKAAPSTTSRETVESSPRGKGAPTTTGGTTAQRTSRATTSSGRATIGSALRSSSPGAPVPPARPMPPRPVEVPQARMSSLPARSTTPAAPAPALFSNRTAALTSLQRSPAPAPAKVPVAHKPSGSPPPRGEVRRQYPRAEIHVRTKLSLADDPSRSFEASLPTVNLSVGGMFLESSFFLKLGTKLLIQLDLPQRGRPVKVKGEVVRVESNTSGSSGFALRFTEYLEGSQVILATHFLSPVLREFLVQYAKEHRFDASAEYLAHTADVLAAWELKKAELGGDVWDLFSSNRQSRA